MTLTFKVDEPEYFQCQERNNFLTLLIKQGQVANPNIKKVNSCPFICIVYGDDKPIGIGAIKQVYKTPFDKAGLSKLKNEFDNELGYLYVEDEPKNNFRGLGIGKTICKLLLKHLGNVNVFATTEDNQANTMKFILTDLYFEKIGNSYDGQNTKKQIGLFIKRKTESHQANKY